VTSNVKVDDILANIRKSIDSDIETLGGSPPAQQRGAMMRDALRGMRATMDGDAELRAPAVATDLPDLRSRIRQKLEAIEAQASTKRSSSVESTPTRSSDIPPHKAFTGILSGPSLKGPSLLRPGYAERPIEDDLRYVTPEPEQQWPDEQYAYEPDRREEQPYQSADTYTQHYGYEQQPYQEQLPSPLMSAQTEAHAETAFRQLSDAILSRATGDRSLEDVTRDMLKTMLKQWLDANLPTIVEELVREEIQRVARRGR
jgi:cell pole-organizing protein PopZ